MKAIITGATGFVGRKVVELLVRQGYEVYAIVNNMNYVPSIWYKHVCIFESDLGNLQEDEKRQMMGADYFFHFAWAGTAGEQRGDIALQLKNIQYTCDALEFADQIGCKKFINAGSIMEYEILECIQNNDKIEGIGKIYSMAKLSADTMAKTMAVSKEIEYINIVISNIYGEGEKNERFFKATLRKMINNEDIPLTQGLQLYDFIHVTDAVKEILLVAERGTSGQNYYIGNTQLKPLREFIIEMKDVLSSTSNLEFGKVAFSGSDLGFHNINRQWIEQWGVVPEISFREGVLRTRDWMLRGGK